MASSYLGPESPRPFSVVCESYQKHLKLPNFAEHDVYRFGDEYENKLFKLIEKYLELDTTDRMCYVGEPKGNLSSTIQDKFCLLEPIMTVHPGHFHYLETDSQKMLPIRIAHVGAEEYFREITKTIADGKQTAPYDKIVLKDAVRYFQDPKDTYRNIMNSTSAFGKVLIIHRAESLTTLPFSSDSMCRLAQNETPYMDVIKHLQSLDFDVQWELECLPIVMPKIKWLSMLKDKYPSQAEMLSDFELIVNERDLIDGALKYGGDLVEFVDRLFFITATRSQLTNGYPVVQRYGRSEFAPFPDLSNLKLTMEVTPDLKKFEKRTQKKKRFSEEFFFVKPKK